MKQGSWTSKINCWRSCWWLDKHGMWWLRKQLQIAGGTVECEMSELNGTSLLICFPEYLSFSPPNLTFPTPQLQTPPYPWQPIQQLGPLLNSMHQVSSRHFQKLRSDWWDIWAAYINLVTGAKFSQRLIMQTTTLSLLWLWSRNSCPNILLFGSNLHPPPWPLLITHCHP